MPDVPDSSAIPVSEPILRWMPDRLANAVWSGFFLSPIALATYLKPSADGFGTHQQLGLPPCTFLFMTGFPCPFCGMTTSWTHAAHGDVMTSISTQPMGFVLFVIALLLALYTGLNAILGRERFRFERVLVRVPARAWWSGLVALLAAWIYKSASIRGWI